MSDATREINRLQALIAELRALPPKVITQDKIITKTVDVPTRIGDRAEKLFNIYKKNADDLARRLAQDMLYYYGLYQKWYKLAQQKSTDRELTT